jgi:hypothetical protein
VVYIVVFPPLATEETGAWGREIESRQGLGGSFSKIKIYVFLTLLSTVNIIAVFFK